MSQFWMTMDEKNERSCRRMTMTSGLSWIVITLDEENSCFFFLRMLIKTLWGLL